ncbi:metallophosphoesterase [uncultured Rikenella sp.]|uniref:metallophosphoesterase family protein n=1 Tax=uncultured Rikenella sp. TaxID=368003 RepID=UPI00272BBB29|nr:metallophosphoesterase [uncultured Rikenella sp.]
MGKSLRIAVISDMHCMYKEDYNSPDTILFSNQLRCGDKKHPIETLIQLIQENDLTCDYVLCPGDIANKADIQGLISGFGFLQEIRSALQAKCLFCAPGNHDVAFMDHKWFDTAHQPLKALHQDYPVPGDDRKRQFLADNFYVYSDEQIVVLCVDSVHNYTDKENAQKTLITHATLGKIQSQLSELVPVQGVIKIALTHHHPIKYSNTDYLQYKDADALENGDQLLDILKKSGFHLLIHGHKHIPRVEIRNDFPIFCAGSFSGLQNLKLGDDANTFHIVDVKLPDDSSPQYAQGVIRTWEYRQNNGWTMNDSPTKGFPALTGFGSRISVADIASKIDTLIGSQPLITYKEVEDGCPFIHWLTPFEQDELTTLLQNQYHLAFFPCLKVGPTQIMKMIAE